MTPSWRGIAVLVITIKLTLVIFCGTFTSHDVKLVKETMLIYYKKNVIFVFRTCINRCACFIDEENAEKYGTLWKLFKIVFPKHIMYPNPLNLTYLVFNKRYRPTGLNTQFGNDTDLLYLWKRRRLGNLKSHRICDKFPIRKRFIKIEMLLRSVFFFSQRKLMFCTNFPLIDVTANIHPSTISYGKRIKLSQYVWQRNSPKEMTGTWKGKRQTNI